MEDQNVHSTLATALDANDPQLVAFVGAGGKTTALQRLGVELAVRGSGIVVTTTTAMFTHQLTALGPLVVSDDDPAGAYGHCRDALLHGSPVTLAKSLAPEGKVRGLAPREIDHLWSQRLATSILVEADGSRGLPLKAFGAAEPQLPLESTIVVVVAGLDVLDQPLDEAHVHRAVLLAPILREAMGTPVTPRILAAALTVQVARVRTLVSGARIVVLLNKAETEERWRAAVGISSLLLPAAGGGARPSSVGTRPQRVVAGSLWRGVYRVVNG